jgi:ribonuclease D
MADAQYCPPNNYQFITTDADLSRALDKLMQQKIVAVDLEGDSMFHFTERICLIQMATPTFNIVIDPLALSRPAALAPLFANRDIQKIFHGADYDIRSLYRDFNIEVHHLFDTQIAAMFLGEVKTGLDALLRDRLGIGLDKRFQKKDWSQRPLPTDMVSYAIQDAVYLLPLADRLKAEIEALGRQSWVTEECRLLSHVRPAENDDAPLYLKFRGAGRLKPRNLAVLEALLQWRQQVAEKKDRPPFKVVGNATLMALSVHRPASHQDIEKLIPIKPRQLHMYADDWIMAIQQAQSLATADLPHYPRKVIPKTPPLIAPRMRAIKKWRDQTARHLGIDAPVLMNKAMMTAVASDNPGDLPALARIPLLRRWQIQYFGQDMLAALAAAR